MRYLSIIFFTIINCKTAYADRTDKIVLSFEPLETNSSFFKKNNHKYGFGGSYYFSDTRSVSTYIRVSKLRNSIGQAEWGINQDVRPREELNYYLDFGYLMHMPVLNKSSLFHGPFLGGSKNIFNSPAPLNEQDFSSGSVYFKRGEGKTVTLSYYFGGEHFFDESFSISLHFKATYVKELYKISYSVEYPEESVHLSTDRIKEEFFNFGFSSAMMNFYF